MTDELEIFCQGLATGLTAPRAADEAGISTLTPIEVSMLQHREDVRKRVEEILRTQSFDDSLDFRRMCNRLEDDHNYARQTGQASVALNARIALAKLKGHFVERKEVVERVAVRSMSQLTPEEWEREYGEKTDESE